MKLLHDDNIQSLGNEMYGLMQELYPICRSITGDGVRRTLEIIQKHIPITIYEVPSGTEVFDWKVPQEWNINDAYIKNSNGEKIIDFNDSNLHVLNYSVPVNRNLALDELKDHLFTLPEYPEWIPYLTSYYNDNWGFCLTHNQLLKLKDDFYEVMIDSQLKEGHLTYGELYIEGKTDEEILLTSYICHPSLCNDNLSGPILLTFLAKQLMNFDLKYSYRFLLIPETIGAITWLSLNEDKIKRIKHGLVATCVGDRGKSTYKRSRHGNAEIDRVVEKVLEESSEPYEIVDFFPTGSDERQFSSPGFDLPMGSLMRTPYAQFPEYHTSADNLNFVAPKYMADSLNKYLKICYILENDAKLFNLNPKCEPQLGKRGLYESIGGQKESEITKLSIFWVLNFSDGENSLLDISIRSSIDFKHIKLASEILKDKNLISDDNILV